MVLDASRHHACPFGGGDDVPGLGTMGRAAQRAQASRARKRSYAGKKADPFYLSESWRRLRREVLERDHYLCQRCKRNPATVVHHIIPRKERPELSRELSNLESVCDACHNALHPERARGGMPGASAAQAPQEGIRVVDLGGIFRGGGKGGTG